MRREDFENQTQ
jgi:hypothetical protein